LSCREAEKSVLCGERRGTTNRVRHEQIKPRERERKGRGGREQEAPLRYAKDAPLAMVEM
jgi:hypothetical protein